MNNTLHNRLRHHVTGAIERGEAQAIVEIPALHKGPFPLHTTKNDDAFVIITNHGTHYAKTFDPSAARLISAGPDLLSALDLILNKINAHGLENKHMIAAIEKAELAISKARGAA